jgi:peptidoglycan/LPS O-acetylase OafA/YrhL
VTDRSRPARSGLASPSPSHRDPRRPRQPPERRADIQGLRAVAGLLVVLFHAGLHLPGGFLGVDVFFVISGFVITSTLLRELAAGNRIDLAGFYVRRVKRLLPAMAVMVTVVAGIGILAAPIGGQRQGALTGASASAYLANAYLYSVHDSYFTVSAALNPFLHTWSLSVEEQFYLAFPLILLIGWRSARRGAGESWRRGSAAAAVLIVTVISYLLWRGTLADAASAAGIGDLPRFSFYGSPARAWEFGVGAVGALAAPWVSSHLSRLGALAFGVAGLGTIAVAATAAPDTSSSLAVLPTGFAPVLPVLGALLVIVAGTATTGGAARLLSVRPAVRLGDLSYSWYLWHWPLIVFAAALAPGAGWAVPLAAAFSLVPAWLSYRFVETPVRASRRVRGRRVAALASVCALVPISVAFASVHAVRALDLGNWRELSPLHADAARGCTSAASLDPALEPTCTWAPAHATGRVVLIGDSNAGQFTEPVVAAAERAGLATTVAAAPGCPLVELQVVENGRSVKPCWQFVQRAVVELQRSRPNLVIIGARTAAYLGSRIDHARDLGRSPETVGLRLPSERAVTTAEEKARLWELGLRSLLHRLVRAGVPVIFVYPTPVFAEWTSAEGCAVVRLLTRTCEPAVSRAAVDRERKLAVSADRSALAGVPGAFGLDFIDELCTPSACRTTRNGIAMYRASLT